MPLPHRIRYAAKSALRPLVFRYPPVGLQPERLMVWLETLERTRQVPGAVLEVGCSVGGTAAVSHQMLRNLGIDKAYVAVDTFGGFVEEQFSTDERLGSPKGDRHMFSASSVGLVRRNLDGFGATAVQLVQGDITTVPLDRLPSQLSAVLIDVDLSEPVHDALVRLVPLVAPGGVVLVDDCPEGTSWKAREGYERYVGNAGLPALFRHGLGIVEVPAAP